MSKVLVVDDTVFMRLKLRRLLETSEFEVVGEAADGIEAVKKYKELKPDLVTMDITMPNMDGITALKEILKLDPKAKIVMVSSLGQESHVRESILSGAKTFIVKPFEEEHVVKTLKQVTSA